MDVDQPCRDTWLVVAADTVHHTDEVVVHLTIDGEELETTPEHPFYVEGNGWVDAEDLQVDDEIRNADGSTGEVQAIETEEISQEMYNLTVDEAHTFFVGDGQWLVHNCADELTNKLIGATGGPYETQKILDYYSMFDNRNKVRYLDESSRKFYEVFAYDNKLVDVNGIPLGGASGKNFIAVMDPSGHIYAGTQTVGYFHHSSFLSGNPISYAGHLEVKSGIISQITARSGHYRPPYPLFNSQLLRELEARGLDILKIISVKGY